MHGSEIVKTTLIAASFTASIDATTAAAHEDGNGPHHHPNTITCEELEAPTSTGESLIDELTKEHARASRRGDQQTADTILPYILKYVTECKEAPKPPEGMV